MTDEALKEEEGSHLIEYARSELERAGLFDDDSDYEGMLGDSVLEIVSVFAKQRHSGLSASLTLQLLEKVLRYQPLTPLTFEPDEWMEVSPDLWQNKRQGTVFSDDQGKTWYDINEEGRPTHVVPGA